MWFAEDMRPVYDRAIAPALDATGYTPFRVDLRPHNEKIDDRIVAEIRRSGLVVADFTGHRGGAYWEAGFAQGLGIPVIRTCRSYMPLGRPREAALRYATVPARGVVDA
jgi:nucleoside 2-deoxyribosyltransferase